ncbi:hypothetical protein NQZ79_g5946 [Umbelopsis isabellina]|nr:hypothetical protein NQZ79_g5946 [Umbelopsis isabellina]
MSSQLELYNSDEYNSSEDEDFQPVDSGEDSTASTSPDPEMEEQNATERTRTHNNAKSATNASSSKNLDATPNEAKSLSPNLNMQKRPLKRFDLTPLFSTDFSQFHQKREMELLKVLEIRRKLTKQHKKLAAESVRKRDLLEQQKKLLKKLEADNVQLTNSIRTNTHGRKRSRTNT